MQCSSQSLYIVEFIPPNTLTLLTILTTVTNWFCQKLNVIFHCLYFWFSWVFESTSKSPWQQALLSPSHRSSHQSLDVSSTAELPGSWTNMNEPYSKRDVCVQRGCWEFMCHVFVCSKRRCPRLRTVFHLTYTPKDQHRTWKWWFGRLFSSSRGVFSGSMLIFRGVIFNEKEQFRIESKMRWPPMKHITFQAKVQHDSLAGGWTNPSEKYARQIGHLPQCSGWKYKKYIWVATN